MPRRLAVLSATLILGASPCPAADGPGPLVRSLWLVHRYGASEAVRPGNDQALKAKLFKALGKDGVLTTKGAEGLMDPATFARLAGPDGRLDSAEARALAEADAPESRQRLHPAVAAHAAALTTSFDRIDAAHRAASEKLADWVVQNYKPGQPLHVICVCTGNSRRSVLGATMGNVAAAYYGMPEIRFHSGGTAPTAVNPRTIAALKAVGVEFNPTGAEAPRGEPRTANPVYTVRWGSGLETTEFSKTYYDAANPQSGGFAALMVCGEADEACPLVKGAAARISLLFLDPKVYDGSAYESDKYAERRDDMGRLMLDVMMQARNRLARTAR